MVDLFPPTTYTFLILTFPVTTPQLTGIIVNIRNQQLRHWHAGLACTSDTASPVSHTGGGALAHARSVAVAPLSGAQRFTPNQPNVNSKNNPEDPHADSNTTYYSALTLPTSLHTPSPSSLTYARPETATTRTFRNGV